MSRPPSSQTTPQFQRVSERDLTEIELHSVDSISDLHRTHHDHSHKGTHTHTQNTASKVYRDTHVLKQPQNVHTHCH